MRAASIEQIAALKAERKRRLDFMKRMADKQAAIFMNQGKTRVASVFTASAERLFNHDDDTQWRFLTYLKRIPVPIEEFIDSRDFLGGVEMDLWPQIRKDIITVNRDIAYGEDLVDEYVDSGATGTGKTSKAHVSLAYQLYVIQCLRSPQKAYGLTSQTPIVLSMASSNWTTTRDVLFRPFMQLVTAMPFFRKYTNWNTDKTSVLEFDNNVQVEPVNATVQGIIGRAVIGGHIDEANYMSVIRGSKRLASGEGSNGVYDQAEAFYRAIKLRRKSRFSSALPVPGMVVLSSSTRYMDDFLDRRIDEVRSSGEPSVRIFRHKQYDVQPAEKFTKEKFRLLVGTPEYSTRILGPEEEAGKDFPANAVVEEIPENYRYEFTHRPEDALRDVCGISTVNLSPFITRREKIIEATERWQKGGNTHPVLRDNVDLAEHGMPVLVPDNMDADITTKRFVHIDLSKTKDRCGICMLRVDKMVEVEVEPGLYERVPYYVVELAISIQPSQAVELDITAVRSWVVNMQAEHKVPLYMVTYDGFNSAESIQTLRKMGIRSELVSMDRTDEPYQLVKRALYQDRLDYPNNEILVKELTQLDRDETSGKVDHPAKGSKDISDAMAGAVYAATTSRLYRNQIYYTNGNGKRIRPTQR